MRVSRLIGFAVVGLVLLAGPQAVRLYTDWLWFGEVGYQSVFSTIWGAQSLLFVVTFVVVRGVVRREHPRGALQPRRSAARPS